MIADRLVHAAINIVAERGFGALSLRDAASGANRSTMTLVSQFGSKAGLVHALLCKAKEMDDAFHREFFAPLKGLQLTADTKRGVAVRYMLARARSSPAARVFQELLLATDLNDASRLVLKEWHDMIGGHWAAFLDRDPGHIRLAPVWTPYLIAEGFYATALAGRLDYALMIDEALFGLVLMSDDGRDPPASVATWFTENLSPPRPPTAGLATSSVKWRLIAAGADQLLSEGLAAVTNRSVSRAAGTSSSMVTYHFGDMETFLGQVVWHSVFRDLPEDFDLRRPPDRGPPESLDAWADRFASTLFLGPGGLKEAGFYVKYARLIAQICLMASRNPAFVDLVLMLRGPEGGGTFGRAPTMWPPELSLTRSSATRFALWIKGQALLEAAVGPDRPAKTTLINAISALVRPTEQPL